MGILLDISWREAVFTSCSFTLCWAGLLKVDDHTSFQAGVEAVLMAAAFLADCAEAPRRPVIQT